MSKPKNPQPETDRVEVIVSPHNYPRTIAALCELKRVMAEEAKDYAKSQNLPDAATPPMIVALLFLSQRYIQGNIAQMHELFPDLLEETQFEDVAPPPAPATSPNTNTKFRGH